MLPVVQLPYIITLIVFQRVREEFVYTEFFSGRQAYRKSYQI